MRNSSTLWNSFVEGDKESYIQLYDHYYQRLYIYGFKIVRNKELVKDCIQEMFLEIWKKKSTLKKVHAVEPYLLTYLRRKIYKEFQDNKNLSDDIGIPEQADMSYEEMLLINESIAEKRYRLEKELKQLTPTQLQIIKMLYYDGLTHDEIAEYTSSSKRTIYNHIYQAFAVLKKGLLFLFFTFS